MTGFRREGIHRTLDCADCHGEDFRKPSADCFSCHAENYRDAKDPDHAANGFSTDCVDLPPEPEELGGRGRRARGLPASGPAPDARMRGLSSGRAASRERRLDCAACHIKDYSATTDPDHKAAGFPTDCVSCHGNGAVSWAGASIDHSQFFALKGTHATLECNACHANGYNLPKDCYGCHAADYNATTDPNHKTAGFSTDCESCHGNGAATWSGASFDHSPFFVLQGAHATLECTACHAKGYNLPKDCYGCHAADYSATTDPNHKASGFPTTCADCHLPTHTSWSQAVFQHDFPIKSGKHAGFSCTDCHLTSNYRQFSCTDCHTHDKAATDSHHGDVAGYVYNSTNCYACHPRGTAGD